MPAALAFFMYLGREVRVSDANNAPAPMAAYFGLVAAGAYTTTDTAAKLLGRAPRSYAGWLERHRSRFVGER